jgi:hypothetical protein
MNRLIRDLIVSIGVPASLIGLVFTVRPSGAPWSPLEIFLFAVAVLLGGVSIYFDIAEYGSRPVRTLKGKRAIRDYMYNWIKNAGGVAVFSRDLSWVDDAEISALLDSKATSGDLTLVLPRPIALSQRLAKLGAKVLYYPSIDYTIRSRFTVVNTGRSDTRVAIGRTEGTRHRVEEFSAGDNPAFYLADDMLQLMNKFCVKS